jgi:RNA polymerase sigma factor (sigma-70 family)
MDTFSRFIGDLFTGISNFPPLTESEEHEAISRAQEGDEEATLLLLKIYSPALRAAANRYTLSLGVEEARAEAVRGLLEAIHAFDTSTGSRLTSQRGVKNHLNDALSQAYALVFPVAVPDRTLRRFFGILRNAGGDVDKALSICQEYAMSREVFMEVLSVVRDVRSLSGEERKASHDPVMEMLTTEAKEDVAKAFQAVDPLEYDVCRLYYGFSDYDPIPDAEIAHRLGFSRQKIQRTRSSALAKMRVALGL